MKTLILLACFLGCISFSTAQDWLKIAQKDGGAVTQLTSNKYGDLYCAAINQVYRSVDQGQSWQKLKTPIDSVVNVQIIPSCDSNGITALFAFGSGQVKRSTDDGHSWQPMAALNDSISAQTLLSMFSTRYGDLLIVTKGPQSSAKLMRSRDNGISFESVAILEAAPFSVFQSIDSTLYTFGSSATRINKDHSTTLLGANMISAATQDFFNAPVAVWAINSNKPARSTNKGDSWTDMSYDLKESKGSLMSLVGGKDGVMFLFWSVPNDSMHVYRLNAGSKSWTRIRDLGYTFRTILGLSNGSMVASSNLGIYSSEEGAASWTNSSIGISTYPLNAVALSQNAIGVAGTNGTLSQSNTNGQNWSTANVPSFNGANQVFDMISTSNGHFVVAGNNGLWKSNDLGLNYLAAQMGSSLISHPCYCVQEVAPMVLYSSTAQGLLRSKDDGQTWTIVDSTAKGPSIIALGEGKFLLSTASGVMLGDTSSAPLTQIAPMPAGKLAGTRSGDLFLVTSETIGSGTKVSLFRKLFNKNIEIITIPSASKSLGVTPWVVAGKASVAYVNTDAGLFRVDAGSTNPTRVDVEGETFSFLRAVDANIAIGTTLYGGVYRFDFSTGVEDPADDKELLVLPQPAMSFLSLQCAENIAHCEVYNMQGQLISSVNTAAQSQQLRVSTENMSSGVYQLRVVCTNGKTLRRQFVVAH